MIGTPRYKRRAPNRDIVVVAVRMIRNAIAQHCTGGNVFRMDQARWAGRPAGRRRTPSATEPVLPIFRRVRSLFISPVRVRFPLFKEPRPPNATVFPCSSAAFLDPRCPDRHISTRHRHGRQNPV